MAYYGDDDPFAGIVQPRYAPRRPMTPPAPRPRPPVNTYAGMIGPKQGGGYANPRPPKPDPYAPDLNSPYRPPTRPQY